MFYRANIAGILYKDFFLEANQKPQTRNFKSENELSNLLSSPPNTQLQFYGNA